MQFFRRFFTRSQTLFSPETWEVFRSLSIEKYRHHYLLKSSKGKLVEVKVFVASTVTDPAVFLKQKWPETTLEYSNGERALPQNIKAMIMESAYTGIPLPQGPING